jgi:hypothetical protein
LKADCDLCEANFETIFSWIDDGDSRQEIIDKYVDMCVELNLGNTKSCGALAEQRIVKFALIFHAVFQKKN